LLVDAGEDEKPEYVSWVKKVLSDEAASLSDVLVTHWHRDHVGGVPQLLSSLATSSTSVSDDQPKLTVRKFPLEGETFEFDVARIKDGDEIKVEGATLK
jgi:glyoxylase-like metal-dependent hydrolase (beta-lactamase superfamily II)